MIHLTVEKKGDDTGQWLTKPVNVFHFYYSGTLPYGHLVIMATFFVLTKRPYMSDLVSLKDTENRYHLRSNNGKLLNIPPYKSFSTLGDRSFCMAAPKLWNDLPLFIRNISSVKALKTYLFQKAFPS